MTFERKKKKTFLKINSPRGFGATFDVVQSISKQSFISLHQTIPQHKTERERELLHKERFVSFTFSGSPLWRRKSLGKCFPLLLGGVPVIIKGRLALASSGPVNDKKSRVLSCLLRVVSVQAGDAERWGIPQELLQS